MEIPKFMDRTLGTLALILTSAAIECGIKYIVLRRMKFEWPLRCCPPLPRLYWTWISSSQMIKNIRLWVLFLWCPKCFVMHHFEFNYQVLKELNMLFPLFGSLVSQVTTVVICIPQKGDSSGYLGKSSSCHSSFTSMLSMRKVASAVPMAQEASSGISFVSFKNTPNGTDQ